MSVAGIASSILTALNAFQGGQSGQTSSQTFQSEMSQLGQDLQSGNLSQAQSDFAALSQNLTTGSGSTSASTAKGSVTQAFNQLGQDLQSGNLSGAQRDYTTIQLDLLRNPAQLGGHHHHHHADGSTDSSSSQSSNPIAQAFSQLAQDLQSGNLSGSQQAFATIENDLQQLSGFSTAGSGGTSASAAPASTSGLNLLV